MDKPGEVANIHMRTEPVQEVFMILLTVQPKIAWQIGSRKLQQRRTIWYTAVKKGKLLDVELHPDFRTLMEHKAFLSTWCRTFKHTREKVIFFLNTLKISLAQTTQEGPFQVMFVGTQQRREQKRIEYT